MELIGLILPPFIDIINTRIANSKLRYVISLLVCLVVGAFIKVNELQAGDVGAVLQSAGIIFVEANAVYRLYYDKSKVREIVQTKLK